MQQIKFGRIEHLRVWHGEPSFDPAPKVVKRLKIGGENGSRLEIGPDFLLKGHVVELFEAIRELDTGVIRAIDVKHGLPFSVEMEVPTGLGPWRGGALRG